VKYVTVSFIVRFDPTTTKGGLIVTAIALLSAWAVLYSLKDSSGFTRILDGSAKVMGVVLVVYWFWLSRLSQQKGEPIKPSTPPSSIRCWRCKADIAVTPELQGKKAKCPKCGTKQQLPG
jgi:hypothetical protein